MKALIHFFSILALMLFFYSCGEKAPGAEEIMTKIAGKYCSEDGDYVLDLKTDSTFINRRSLQSLIQGKAISETCKGKYTLQYDESAHQWWLHFEMKKSALTTSECSGKELIWDVKEGFLCDRSGGVLKERMQNIEVFKGKCSF